jgi:hypothetical protein
MPRLRHIQRLRFRRGAARHYNPATLRRSAYVRNNAVSYGRPQRR